MLANHSLALMASTHKRMLLSQLIDEYLSCLAKSSVKNLSCLFNDFMRFCTDKYINDITVNHIQKYINDKYDKDLKDTTIYRYYRAIKTLFNYAISHEYLEKNPCSRYQSEARTRFRFTHDRLFKKIHSKNIKII